MNLKQLQSALQDERGSNRLQPLPEAFYADVETFTDELREQRDAAAEDAANAFDSQEVMSLSQKIQRAEETLEKLYNRRVGKIINQAVLAATGGTFDKEPLTANEETLYTDIIASVKENREESLSAISESAGGTEMFSSDQKSTGTVSALAEENEESSDEPSADEPDNSADDYMGSSSSSTNDSTTPNDGNSDAPTQSGGYSADVAFGDADTEPESEDAPDDTDSSEATTSPPAPSDLHETEDVPTHPDTAETDDDFTDEFHTDETDNTSDADSDEDLERADGGTTSPSEAVNRVTVQVTEDIGEVFGIDNRTYDLSKDDVVTLPQENAQPLLEKDAATAID